MFSKVSCLSSLYKGFCSSFTYVDEVHANYGWHSWTQLIKKTETIQNSVLKIIAQFFALVLDATLGFGIAATLLYNPAAFLYNKTIAKDKNLAIGLLNQKIALNRKYAYEVILECGIGVLSCAVGLISNTLIGRYFGETPDSAQKFFDKTLSLIAWTTLIKSISLGISLGFKETGLLSKKDLRIMHFLESGIFYLYVANFFYTLVHELGHAIPSLLLFENSKPVIVVKNEGGGYCGGRSSFKLTDMGKLVGKEKAEAILSAGGPLIQLLFSLLQMTLGFSIQNDSIKSHLNVGAFLNIVNIGSYALSGMKSQTIPGHDFKSLWENGGIHPLVSFFVGCVMPLALHLFLLKKQEFFPFSEN